MGNRNSALDKKLPIILAHGALSRNPQNFTCTSASGDECHYVDRSKALVDFLEANGASVYECEPSLPVSTLPDIAQDMKQCVLQVCATSGSPKVNMIGLLDGGLAARYMISNLDLATNVATLTTINTPHRGSILFDALISLVNETEHEYFQPKYVFDLREAYVTNAFNPNTPNHPEIYYQSYGSVLSSYGSSSGEEDDIIDDLLDAVKDGTFLLLPENMTTNTENGAGSSNSDDDEDDDESESESHDTENDDGLSLSKLSDYIYNFSGVNNGISTVSGHKWGRYRGLLSSKDLNAFDAVLEWTTFPGWEEKCSYYDIIRLKGYGILRLLGWTFSQHPVL